MGDRLKGIGDDTVAGSHSSTFLSSYRRISVLQGEPNTESILRGIENGHNAIVEGKCSIKSEFVKNYIKKEEPIDFFLCLTARTAYRIEISEVLENFFLQENVLDLLFVERVNTVVHEAFTNAFLWSCLELASDAKKQGVFSLSKYITDQLKKDSFGRRLLALEVARGIDKLKIIIYVQGKPISWDLRNTDNDEGIQGTSIIKALADEIYIPPEADKIQLIFKF